MTAYGSFPPTLFPPQQELLSGGLLEGTENWIIVAATGAGKTMMAEWALLSAVNAGRRAAYIVPLKAVLEQKYQGWRANWPSLKSGLFTGDTPNRRPTTERLLLMTPEKMAAYIANPDRHLSWLAEIDVLVVDEFHMLGDLHRGAALEGLLLRLPRINPFVRVIGLTATLSNADDLASWLGARVLQCPWRPVPIEHRVRKFSTVVEKDALLAEEINQTRSAGGRALVFASSRRRCERLARRLRRIPFPDGCRSQTGGNDQNADKPRITAEPYHAGLPAEVRRAIERQIRDRQIDVVVATSSLEMGVNLPVRTVIVYDADLFDGDRFTPISIQRYLQFSGRAGRPGLDESGQSILLLPAWRQDGFDYLNASPEPVRSALCDPDHQMREALRELHGGLSTTVEQLQTNLLHRSLWRRQGGQPNAERLVERLVAAEMVRRKTTVKQEYLTVTPLGRIAARHSLSPRTILFLKSVTRSVPALTEFDVLCLACLVVEATPRLPVYLHQIDRLSEGLSDVDSRLLDGSPDFLFGHDQRLHSGQLVSALKMAFVLGLITNGVSLRSLVERWGEYESDYERLRVRTARLLRALTCVFSVTDTGLSSPPEGPPDSTPHVIAQDLVRMLDYGVPRHALGLTHIAGIGPIRAGRLLAAGVDSVQCFRRLTESQVATMLKVTRRHAGRLATAAGEIQHGLQTSGPHSRTSVRASSSIQENRLSDPSAVDGELICLRRLRRAIQLSVVRNAAEGLIVGGGAELHQVRVLSHPHRSTDYSCDCRDYLEGTRQCKHILRARLARHDADAILARLAEVSRRPAQLRDVLPSIWSAGDQSLESVNEPAEWPTHPTARWLRSRWSR